MKNSKKLSALVAYSSGIVQILLLLAATSAFLLPRLAVAQSASVLQGTVTDRGTGLPVAGAAIYSTTSGNTGVVTDANGNYALTGAQLSNMSSGTLYFSAHGYWQGQAAFSITSSPTIVNATLLPGAGTVIQGTVTDANTNAAIVGASIQLEFPCTDATGSQIAPYGCGSYGNYYVYATSTAGGVYTIDSSSFPEVLATANVALIYENVNATGYLNRNVTLQPSYPWANLPKPYPSTHNISLDPASAAVLQGTVTDRGTGLPVAGAAIYSTTSGNTGVVTDANGNYALTGAQLSNMSSGTLYFSAHGYWQGQAAFSITSSPTIVNATLLPGAGTVIQGTVTDANTNAAIVGASIQLEFPCTDATGSQIAPYGCGSYGNYYVYATSTAGGVYTIDSSSFPEVLATANVALIYENVNATGYLNRNVTLQPSYPWANLPKPYPSTHNISLVYDVGVILQGTLTDRGTGLPVAGAAIYSTTSGNTGVVTDANGNYALTGAQLSNMSSGTLYFSAHGYWQGQAAFSITSSPTIVNATLLPGAGTVIQGTVTDANTNAAIVGASIQLEFPCTDATGSQIAPYGCGSYGNYYVYATSTAGGVYTIDSSSFPEVLATANVALIYENVNATGYLNRNVTLQPSYPWANLPKPYPSTHKISLVPSGLTENVIITTVPLGLGITVDGVAAVSPQAFAWVPGNEHTIATSSPQTDSSGKQYGFVAWNNGGTISQTVVVPNGNTAYIASFVGTAPTVTPTVTGTLGSAGWYTSNVVLNWSVTDPVASITSQTGCGPASVTTDTSGQTFTCSATSDGGTTTQSVTIKRDTSPPVVSGTLSPAPNINGWNSSSVIVSFGGTDSTSGIASCSSNVVISSQGANQAASGSCTDQAGNVGYATVSNINIDESPPTVSDSVSVSVPESPTGWYTAPVTISFAGTDPLSGVLPGSCTAPVTLSDGMNQTVTGTCTNLAGISAPIVLTGINVDSTPPIASFTASPPPNGSGWNNSTVTVTFAGTDSINGSGVAGCSAPITIAAEGTSQTASGTCSDVAGNTSTPVTDSSINIDLTPPSISIVNPARNSGYPVGTPLIASYNCTDALSGLAPGANCMGPVAAGAPIDTSVAGAQAFAVTAADVAGNVQTLASSYLISSLTLTTPGTIWTFAGIGAQGYLGDGGLAINASLATPTGMAFDSTGNAYIADYTNSVIRKVTPAGIISTYVGTGAASYSGDGGPANAASINYAPAVAVDGAGNLYIADESNHRIRRVTPGGIISTIAGNGSPGYSGDNGPATNASLNLPFGVAIDPAGNLYISDRGNLVVRKVTPNGTISTVAGTGSLGYSGDGGPATSANLSYTGGIAVDTAGNLYIADGNNNAVRRVTPAGVITTVAGDGKGTAGFSGDGGPATSATLSGPLGVAVDSAGSLYIADQNNHAIRQVSPAGTISTLVGNGSPGFAGDGTLAAGAQLNNPYGVAVDASGNLYIADVSNDRVRFMPHVGPSADTTPPVITPAVTGSLGTNGWYTSNVTVTWAVTDPDSSITNTSGCTTVTISTDTAGQTITCSATSSGGTASNSVTIKRDASAPTATITTPANGGNYVSGGAVNAVYSCADTISGVATCLGTVANGAPINTSGTGTKSFTVTATDKAGNVTPSVVTYTVAVAAPAFTLAPSTVPFGSQALNVSTTALPITMTSTGNSAVSVTSIRVTGANANQFTQTNNCGTSVAAGAACTINVVFRPTSAGTKTATITVVTGNAGTKTVNLTGTGVASSYTVSPSTLAFGSEQTNVATAAQIVTVTNTASVALPLTSISLGGTNANQFSQTNTCGTSVAAVSSCTISVIFTPTSAGAKSATLSVRPSGAATQTVALSGTGVVPTYTVTPSPLAFGSQAVGVASAGQTLTLTNTGTLVLPITSIALSGGSTNQFSLSNTCGASIAPSTTCSITVAFRPTSTGAKSTSVRVTAGSGAATVSVPVTGTGIVPTYSLLPTSLAYGNQARNTASPAQTITLTNTGTLDLPITSVSLTGGNANQFSQTNTCGTLVTAGSSCTINVVFRPTSTGNKTATLRVTPGGGAATQSVSLTGTGI